MKIARIIGLAAIAALALTALVGAGSASAAKTTLCKTNTISPYCEAKDRYAANTEIKSGAPTELQFEFKSPTLNVTCSNSAFAGKTTAASAEPLPVSVSSWTVKECEKGCVSEFKNLPYAGSLSRTTGADGTLTVGSGGGGEPRLYVKCGEIVHCEYQVPGVSFKGGNTAQMTLAETTLSAKGGFYCPKTSTLKPVTYTVSTPQPAYVATPPQEELHTRLCKTGGLWFCEDVNTYPYGTTLEAEAPELKIKTASPGGTITCGKTTLSGQTQAVGAEPLPFGPVTMTSTGCVYSIAGNCKVTSSSLLPGAELTYKTEALASFRVRASLKFECGWGAEPLITCQLSLKTNQPPFYSSGIFDPELATFSYNENVLERESSTCPGENKLSANFKVTSPKPLFVR